MQWDASQNAGLSTAPPEKMYLPVIDDDVYGYKRVNVAQAESAPDSLLNWLRRALKIRAQHHAFGRGELQTLACANPAIFAYTRTLPNEQLLIVNNLTAHTQTASLDLATPGALHDHESSETIPLDAGLQLNLPRYGYRWFQIRAA
jgi:maltose alpha-D-glucosyltransferase/alpha-amylase